MAGNRRRPAEGASVRLVWTGIAGVLLGTAAFGGYILWSHAKAHQDAIAAPGDPQLAQPSAEECGIARVALTAVHAAGDDARWRALAADKALSLRARSQTINPVDTPGYADDEADDLRAKAPADWRWCAGMGAFVVSLGWTPITPDDDIPELGMTRPAMDKAGDEAKVYEVVVAPDPSGVQRTAQGPWLVTLHRASNGAWSMTGTTALPRRH